MVNLMVKGRCMKCQVEVDIADAKQTKTKNGRTMMKGKCPKCGTTVCRFVAG